MKHYFIDFENVHSDGLKGIETLEKFSNINILYSDNSKSMSLEVIEKAAKNNVKINAYKIVAGKNALDFQLSSYLGYFIGITESVDCEFFIVSKDTGFDCVVEFWNDRGIKISRIHSLMGESFPEPAKEEKKVTVTQSKATTKKKASTTATQTTEEELREYLSDKEYTDEILRIVNQYKTRMAINNGLTALYKSTNRAGAIYNKIKPLLKEKGKK